MNLISTGELDAMRIFFQNDHTRSFLFRRQQLHKLKQAILDFEEKLYDALYTDLRKSREESWVTELGLVIAELNNAIANLKRWMAPEKVPTNLLNLPSKSMIMREPLGVVLIAAPWNYPFQLLLNPLVGAIAAGNCVVLKPSEFAPATASVMRELFQQNFPAEFIRYVEGDGAVIVPHLMKSFRFDHVFYTGSTAVGKIIYQMAAEKLVPVTLELGGKSPCVVESDANIDVAGKRIALTKFSNAGQMCVAPDYVLVHESQKEKLTDAIQKAIVRFFGTDPSASYNYGKIINEKQFNRLSAWLATGNILHGGRTNPAQLYIEPTIVTDVQVNSPLMKEEIFGPVLPIIAFNDFQEAVSIINQHPDPLAFYLFTGSRQKEKQWLEKIPFGGGCINNASWHLTNHHLPFGGRGSSGTGSYHGKFSFDTFSHRKAVMKTPTWFDPAIKYPPFKGKLNLFKRVIR